MSSSSKQSIWTATEFVEGLQREPIFLFVSPQDSALNLILNDGRIMKMTVTGAMSLVYATGGSPTSAAYSTTSKSLYIADMAFSSILAIDESMIGSSSSSRHEVIVSEYEDKPLKGPSCVVTHPKDGSIFFTDAGPMGETGIHNPTGSIFTIAHSITGQILRPITLGTLANPTCIAISSDGRFLYVTEMMSNRIIRYFQHQPQSVYHGSVFYTFTGGVGPSAIVIDPATGYLLVASYDIKEGSKEGIVYVISRTGALVGHIFVRGPEISSLAVNNSILYIAERSTKSIFKFDLNSL